MTRSAYPRMPMSMIAPLAPRMSVCSSARPGTPGGVGLRVAFRQATTPSEQSMLLEPA
eukprot:CAMPEP_0180113490 /NCGR_PEP_ID=MMETSP0985-20121206/36805_1 /TAXON_ID=483367 /ORGANISM="non described non described, Strain CCMP 2436" /LENGTH=57 /DNA_ID=CAMNT_0022051987 /DNA_START=331 /DNA_END=500 /DNA_ORIENTATION=+